MVSMNMKRSQLTVFLILLVVYAFCAFATYAFFTDELAATAGVPMPDMGVSNVVLGLANAGIVLVVYGLLGWAGFLFARKLGLPGVFSEDGNWKRWFFIPLLLGLICGVMVVIGDILFAPINGFGHLVLFVGLVIWLIDLGLLWFASKGFRRGELMTKF
jgi:hypothetical protein